MSEGNQVPCPFIYANGKKCPGHVVRIEGYKADLEWKLKEEGWSFGCSSPRSHYHLFCSEKDNHAGVRGSDSEKMKFYYDQLPPTLQAAIRDTTRR